MGQPGWKRPFIATVKALVAVLVLWAVGRHVLRVWNDLKTHEVVLQVQPVWLIVSAFFYLAGLACCGRFYERVLRASASPIALGPALRAYLVSHLGKYVPGKAMVVLMRAGMSVPFGARGATAAIATFYETLVMMATGGLLAALGLAFMVDPVSIEVVLYKSVKLELGIYRLSALVGLGVGSAFLIVVLPPVFRRLSTLVSLPFPSVDSVALPRFSSGLLMRGLAWTAAAWIFLGASQLEVAHALSPMSRSEYIALLPLVTAGVALATVAGFVVAVLPGGLGVREGVLMYVLGPTLGDDLAVVAALALRLVWVAAEVLAAVVLLPLYRWHHRRLGAPPQGSSAP